MKTITKMVTRKEEFYVARDGKEFDDRCECLDYENELNINSIESYDEDFNRIDFDSATYVVIHSDEELNLICDVCVYNGWTSEGLCENGLYRYSNNYRNDRWEKVKIPYFLKDFVEFI